ncbi:MAG: formyltetrahydrofolate deformylase [bacterium]
MNTDFPSYTLTISCVDKQGIVAAVANFIAEQKGNIIYSAQHSTDHLQGKFFMRMLFDPSACGVSLDEVQNAFLPIAQQFSMEFSLHPTSKKKRVAIMVSKYDHCLVDLLWRWESKELDIEIPMIISNHEDLRFLAERYGVPYHYFPISKDNKEEMEEKMLSLLEGQVDLIVLARYMRILGQRFIDSYPKKIINIHHSFLPAFIGANPYERAFTRGVKLIGATAHYATLDLDEGPIIFQDVTRVSHEHSVDDLIRKGRDIERQVLAQAVRWHVEDRVFVEGNKTVVFE